MIVLECDGCGATSKTTKIGTVSFTYKGPSGQAHGDNERQLCASCEGYWLERIDPCKWVRCAPAK